MQRPFAIDVDHFGGKLLPHAAEHFESPPRPDFKFHAVEASLKRRADRLHELVWRFHLVEARADFNRVLITLRMMTSLKQFPQRPPLHPCREIPPSDIERRLGILIPAKRR